jgi:hypothetical protein
MSNRKPPGLAGWIVRTIAPVYRRQSFIGDLNEEYSQGRSALWYWGEVAALLVVICAKRLQDAVSVRFAAWLLRLTGEALAVAALVALAYQNHGSAAPELLPRALMLAGLALLCLLVSALAASSSARRLSAVKRMLAAFAAITLGAATLTWAGAPSSPIAQPSHTIGCAEAR